MKKKLFLFLLCALALSGSTAFAQDNLVRILKDELKVQFESLQKEKYPPYYMSYRVIDKEVWSINTSMGAVMSTTHFRTRSLLPQIRIGNTELDNFKNSSMGSGNPSVAMIPLDNKDIDDAVKQSIWNETNNRYKIAVMQYQNDLTKKTVNVKSDDSAPCFSEAKVETYYEEDMSEQARTINMDEWCNRLKEISGVFKENKDMRDGTASITYTIERRYYIDTEGREVVQNLPYARIMVFGKTVAEDGMELPMFNSYFSYDPNKLPDTKSIVEDTKRMVNKLAELRNAPIVNPYTGPALLSGAASGVFFHEIFGHRVEGQRMKSDKDGQTFKKMVGQYVLPKMLQVYDDPTCNSYNGEDLNGYYKFDDQGIRAERVNVVVDGKLNEFLMTRTPIDGHPRSNGHARGEGGLDAVSRQSNLIIETKDNKTEEELRTLLINEAKRQGKDFGFFFKEVTGGLTFTGSGSINSFNVTPLEVYKIYVDGRPDELVRGVDLIGTPLSMFSNIIDAGGKSQIFTGICGAESGQIPVTAISPTILVNKVEVQRKNKSQELPPILPRP